MQTTYGLNLDQIANKKKELERLKIEELKLNLSYGEAKIRRFNAQMAQYWFDRQRIFFESLDPDPVFKGFSDIRRMTIQKHEKIYNEMVLKNQLFSERKLQLIKKQQEKILQEIQELEQENSLFRKNICDMTQQAVAKQAMINENQQFAQKGNNNNQFKQQIQNNQFHQNQIQQEWAKRSFTNSQFSNFVDKNSILQSQKNPIMENQYQQYKNQKNLIEEQCAVCLINMEEQEIVTVLKCNHCFHQKCIMDWLKKSATCPWCRKQQ